MKALALAAALSLTFSFAAFAQDSRQSLKTNGVWKRPAEAAVNTDVAVIQRKIEKFSELLKKDSMNDKFYVGRGQCYQRIGKYDLARDDFNHAISLNPNQQDYFQIRAHLFAIQDRYRESYADYSRALACGPSTHGLLLKQGQAAFMANDYDSAYSAAKSAFSLKSDDVDTLLLLGSSEQKKGLFQDSLKHLTKAIDLNPSNGDAFRVRADTYSKLGKEELAKQDRTRAKGLGFVD